jgi:hypothetical protein
MAKAAKTKKKSIKTGLRRRERRFATSPTFMPVWVGLVGSVGSAVLGAGVFGLWILDPALSWASYLVAGGGFGLGVALWFGQPPESAVIVGDSGIGVEGGRETARIPWFELRSLRVIGGTVVAEGASQKLKFLLGANPHATASLLKEAAERVPGVVDIQKSLVESLPEPKEVKGYLQDVTDDQVTGLRCAASDKLITLEEDARFCPKCGQIFHKDGVPTTCTHCETELSGRTLKA